MDEPSGTPTGLAAWEAIVADKLPGLSKPQAVVLAMWSFGIVLTRSCGLSTVTTFLAQLLAVKENTMRQRLREWYKGAEAKKGAQRDEVDVTRCFAPLVEWVLSWWSAEEQRLALVMDASTLGQRFVVLAISIVYRGCAIPVAWVVLPGGTAGAWRPHWEALLAALDEAVPADWTVLVLADRGLYARWLYAAITDNDWHPFLRVNHSYGTYRPTGEDRFRPLARALPPSGGLWSGTVTCYKSNPLDCTLLAAHDEAHEDPWLILTDLAPNQADVCWYAMRPWIECGFKHIKRGGWGWHRTRMTDPQRATRLWLALALATLWVVSVGGEAEDEMPASSLDALPVAHIAHRLAAQTEDAHDARALSCFRRGALVILAALLAHRPLPRGCFRPAPWPTQDRQAFTFFDSS